jgi:hypothetical protein
MTYVEKLKARQEASHQRIMARLADPDVLACAAMLESAQEVLDAAGFRTYDQALYPPDYVDDKDVSLVLHVNGDGVSSFVKMINLVGNRFADEAWSIRGNRVHCARGRAIFEIVFYADNENPTRLPI